MVKLVDGPEVVNASTLTYSDPLGVTDVTTLLLLSYKLVAYKLPPTPSPPVTTNAPVVVPVDTDALDILIA